MFVFVNWLYVNKYNKKTGKCSKQLLREAEGLNPSSLSHSQTADWQSCQFTDQHICSHWMNIWSCFALALPVLSTMTGSRFQAKVCPSTIPLPTKCWYQALILDLFLRTKQHMLYRWVSSLPQIIQKHISPPARDACAYLFPCTYGD